MHFFGKIKEGKPYFSACFPCKHKTINKKLLSEVKSRDTMGEIPALRKSVWFLSDKQ